MKTYLATFAFAAIGLIALDHSTGETQEQPPLSKADLTSFKLVRPILERHCSSCHGEKKQEGQLNITKLDADLIRGADAEHWQEVLDRLNAGTMPPKGKSKLTAPEREQITTWLTAQLKLAAEVRRTTGGRTVLRRMTRYEYNNTLRDLLGVDMDFAKDLPPEAAAEFGFQNNSKVLVTSFLHVDYFQKIAKSALETAFGPKNKPVAVQAKFGVGEIDAKKTKKKGNAGTHLPPSIAANDSVELKLYDIPTRGPVMIRVTGWSSRTAKGDFPQLRVEMGSGAGKGAKPRNLVANVGMDAVERSPRSYEFHVRAEDYPIGIGSINKSYQFLAISNYFDPGTSDLAKTEYPILHITNVELVAPYFGVWPPETRTRILVKSKTEGNEREYAREVIEKFMPRAYRRPVSADEVARMHDLFIKLRTSAGSFEEAMIDTLSAVLSSPGFLLLAEPSANRETAEKARKLTDYELASRLSYFLWSTMPDETLFALAAKGKLQDDGVLREQVKRMLEDPKSNQFSQRFVSQWLDLESVDRVAVNPEFFPNFKDELKPLMRQETVKFFDTVLRENLSCFTLLDSDFAMLNASLARHYGIPGVAGDYFRKVSLKREDHRGGILTHAGILTGNSSGDDTHPVKRGVWVLERLLNDPPPPPPPEVPTLAQQDKKGVRLSLKEKLITHRESAACMNCHKKIDPWGLAFENYNGIGVWQETGITKPTPKIVPMPETKKKKGAKTGGGVVPGREVDANTELPDGTQIAGMDDLKKYLLTEKRDRFAETLVVKLFSYAMWRNLEFSDRQAVQELSQAFRKSEHRIRPLITAIALSETFRHK